MSIDINNNAVTDTLLYYCLAGLDDALFYAIAQYHILDDDILSKKLQPYIDACSDFTHSFNLSLETLQAGGSKQASEQTIDTLFDQLIPNVKKSDDLSKKITLLAKMFVSNWDKDIAKDKPPVKTKQPELQALVRKIMQLKFKINKHYSKYQVAYRTTTEEDAKKEVDKIKANLT